MFKYFIVFILYEKKHKKRTASSFGLLEVQHTYHHTKKAHGFP